MQISYSLVELENIAKSIISEYPQQRIFCFEGDLGAGKTTLIEAICRILGAKDELSSPTFSIINEYATYDKPIYHMDWYRLKSIDEAINIGIEDYLFSNNYCFIEWHDRAEALIPRPYMLMSLTTMSNMNRNLIATEVI